jgi:hypothetical protein
MAKAKKKRKVSGVRRRRSRRMSGTTKLMDAGMKLLGAGIGAAAGVFINQAVKTSFTTMPTYTGGFVDIAAGVGGIAFGGGSPFVEGAAIGMMGMGAVFVVNETFLSLPGISGIPQGVPNARAIPGNYLSNAVAGYRGMDRNPGMGNMSGANGRAVGMGAIYRN